MTLTMRRRIILQAVYDIQKYTTWYPTVRDIAKRVNLGTGTTHTEIKELLQLGFLEQNDTHSQLRITEAGRNELPIPYLPTSKVSS